MEPWTLTVAVTDGADAELVSAQLWSLGTTGIAESDSAGTTELTACSAGGATLTAGFANRAAALRAVAALGRPGAEVAPAEAHGWVDRWRAGLRPTRTGPFVVRAPWHPPTGGDATDLVIDPGPAFGHGGHPTTRLALARLPELVLPGASLLDVGSGSGVLAVAGAVLGARPVVALDTDPDAVAATIANAAANGVDLDARLGTVTPSVGRFDVVVANLLAVTLRDLGPALVAATAGHGRLVVSGLLDEQAEGVVAALHPLVVAAEDHEAGWAVLELAAPVRPPDGRVPPAAGR